MIVLNLSLSTIHPISGRKQPTATGLTRPALAPIRSPATCTVEMQTGGEPVRLILEFPEPHGASLERCGIPPRPPPSPPHAGPPRSRRDVWRTRGSCRPTRRIRGAVHAPSRFQHHVRPRHNSAGRWAVASGRVPLRDGFAEFILECPCGPVAVHVSDGGARVSCDSVPAFAAALDMSVELPGAGRVLCDIGYGGAFYAILPARASASTCTLRRSDICAQRHSRSCRRSARGARPAIRPKPISRSSTAPS